MGKESKHIQRHENIEYWFPTDSNPELDHFLPSKDSIPIQKLEGNEKVPKEYSITQSPTSAAFEDQEIKEFKQKNFENIRYVGQQLDEIQYDQDNNEEMQRPEIKNRIFTAYQELDNIRDRTKNFNPDPTSIIYTDESKKVFLEYVDEIEERLEDLGRQYNIDLDISELDPGKSVNVHSLLEPDNRNHVSGSIEMSKATEKQHQPAD